MCPLESRRPVLTYGFVFEGTPLTISADTRCRKSFPPGLFPVPCRESVSDVLRTCAVRLGPQLTQRKCIGREWPDEDVLTGEIIQNNEM